MSRVSTLVLFDIDGTLLGTGGAGKVALNQAFEATFGIAGAFDGVSFVGSMDCKLFNSASQRHLGRAFTSDEESAFIEQYVTCLTNEFNHRPFEVYEGVLDTLRKLAADSSVVLGIATGNLEKAAWAKLRHAKLDTFFSVGGYGMSGPERLDMTRLALKSTIRHHGLSSVEGIRCILVGDSIYDMHCAKALGMEAWGVLTGWTEKEPLVEAGADRVCDHVGALPWPL